MRTTTKRFYAKEYHWLINRERATSLTLAAATHTQPQGGTEEGVALFVGKNLVLCMTAEETAELANTLIDVLETTT